MRRFGASMIVFLAPLAYGTALVAACGESLGESGTDAPPGRDAASDGTDATDPSSDAARDGGNPDGNAEAVWSCTTATRSEDFTPVKDCMGARADAACDNSLAPPTGPCRGSDAAPGNYCSLCTSEAGVYHYDLVSCACPQ